MENVLFISTSQPLLITQPPSLIHPTIVNTASLSNSVVSTTTKISSKVTTLSSSDNRHTVSEETPKKPNSITLTKSVEVDSVDSSILSNDVIEANTKTKEESSTVMDSDVDSVMSSIDSEVPKSVSALFVDSATTTSQISDEDNLIRDGNKFVSKFVFNSSFFHIFG